MRNRTKWIIAAAVLAIALGSCKIYNLRERAGGSVLWNADEAYLFIFVTREGLPVSFLRYPWFFIKGRLGAVDLPDDESRSLVVMRVTSSGVEHHPVKVEGREPASGPGMFTPLEGRIYANYPALGGLCWWAGDHFEQATQEERLRLDGIDRLTVPDIDNGEGGWSRRGFGIGPVDNTFRIEVGEEFGLSVTDVAPTPNGTGNGSVSIDLLYPGKAPKRIWEFDARMALVSRTEYQHIFKDRE